MPALITFRRASGLAAAAAVALMLSACSSASSPSPSPPASPSAPGSAPGSSAAATSGGTYNVGLITPTGGIDPLTTTQSDTMFAVGLASAQLVIENPSGTVEPQLATSWAQSADKLSWTFTLRPGLKFSNGQALTARDVGARPASRPPRRASPGSSSRSLVQARPWCSISPRLTPTSPTC